MYRTIKQNAIGLLLLQETHLTKERQASIKSMFKGRLKILFTEHPESPTRKEGVAVVINKSQMNAANTKVVVVVAGRALQVTVQCLGGDELRVLCIYAPTSDGVAERQGFYQKVEEFYTENPDIPKPHLMAGDFNNTEEYLDRIPVAEPDASLASLDNLKVSLGLMLADGWRMTHPNTRAYTFHRGTGANATCSRLDRIYTTCEIFDRAREWNILTPGVKTDHSLVSVQLTMESAPIVGKGRPSFALALLKDKKLAKQMKASGIEAIKKLGELEAKGIRNDENNAQIILYDLKTALLELARAREKEKIPKLLAQAKTLEMEYKKLELEESANE
ncbi:DNase I-like protein, partial [Trametes versicolor FP-101664 SS1]|uniref:DNase I-like protein n=1 Tax=Trametes versicolor (strain FP-101664) TaxID=717944 RepID=UPI0004624494